MLVLAIDTTSEGGGAGIFRDEECLASVRNEGSANYSVALFQIVEKLLQETRLHLREIDLFAAANGPGSFTGIRVGLAAAQGWSNALNKPVRGIPVLNAMLEEANPAADYAAPILDARRGEFYAGWFERNAGKFKPAVGREEDESALRAEGLVMKPERLLRFFQAQLPERKTLACIARQSDAQARALQSLFPLSFRWLWINGYLVPAIARLAIRAQQESRPVSSLELSACYVRRSDAELHWKE